MNTKEYNINKDFNDCMINGKGNRNVLHIQILLLYHNIIASNIPIQTFAIICDVFESHIKKFILPAYDNDKPTN